VTREVRKLEVIATPEALELLRRLLQEAVRSPFFSKNEREAAIALGLELGIQLSLDSRGCA
jgi:hypothetical protein